MKKPDLFRSAQKLTLTAFSNEKLREQDKLGSFSAPYNPQTLKLGFRAEYQMERYINHSETVACMDQLVPERLDVELLLDATLPGNTDSINDQVAWITWLVSDTALASKEVRPERVARANEIYALPFVKLTWGELRWLNQETFLGRVSDFDVSYTLFGKDGAPLRARVALNFMAASSTYTITKKPRSVRSNVTDKSTLPNIANTLTQLGAAAGMTLGIDYLDLAIANGLDHLDDILPGNPLHFFTG